MPAGIIEDIVVDLTLDVDPGTDADGIAAGLRLPGVEILRTASASTVWLTVLVAAATESAAVVEVRRSILDQIADGVRIRATAVTSAPLGELHARLDTVEDEDVERVSLRDLVEAHMWDPRVAGRAPRRGSEPLAQRAS